MNENTLTRSPLSTAGHRDIVVFASAPVTGASLLEAAYGGVVRFAKVRETGTLRGWPVLKPNSSERKSAESLAAAVAKNVPVATLAKEANVSVATLRRTLTSLAFTQALEGMNAKDRAAIAKSANKPAPKPEKAEKSEKPAEPAKAEPKAPVAKSPAKAGKGGFVPTTKAGRAAAARKQREVARAAKAAQTKEA